MEEKCLVEGAFRLNLGFEELGVLLAAAAEVLGAFLTTLFQTCSVRGPE